MERDREREERQKKRARWGKSGDCTLGGLLNTFLVTWKLASASSAVRVGPNNNVAAGHSMWTVHQLLLFFSLRSRPLNLVYEFYFSNFFILLHNPPQVSPSYVWPRIFISASIATSRNSYIGHPCKRMISRSRTRKRGRKRVQKKKKS